MCVTSGAIPATVIVAADANNWRRLMLRRRAVLLSCVCSTRREAGVRYVWEGTLRFSTIGMVVVEGNHSGAH